MIFQFPDVSSALFDAWATVVVAALVIVAAAPPLVACVAALACGIKGAAGGKARNDYEPLPDGA